MNEHNFQRDIEPVGEPGRSRRATDVAISSDNFGLAPPGFPYAANLGDGWSKSHDWFNPETLFRIWRVLMRRRRLVGGVVLLCMLLGLLVTFLMPSVYKATATLQLSRESAKIVNMDAVDPEENSGGAGREFFETQYSLLKSRSLAEKVVQALNLDAATDPGQKRVGFFTWLGRLVGGGSDDPADAPTAVELASRRAAAASRVLGMVEVLPLRNSQLVSLNVSDTNPILASRVANALAESYIASSLDRRYDASSYARSFLEDRLRELKLKVEESEKELVAYAQDEAIINTDDNRSLLSSTLIAGNNAFAAAQAERIRNEELWKQAQAMPALSLPQAMDNETVRDIREKLAQVSAEYQQKLSQFKPAFPQMLQLKAKMDELQLQLSAQGELVKESIRTRYEGSVQQEKVLAQQLETLKGDVLTMRDRLIRYNILQREVDSNKSLYDGLLQRYKEVGIAGGIGASNISIIDRAEVPKTPYSPKLSLNLAIAGLLGLLLGVATAFGLEVFDDTLKSPDQAEEKIGIPVVGVIPLIDKNEDVLTALDQPRSNLSEAYRSLRTALQFSSAEGAPKSLFITSSQPGEGKSTTSVALAKNFAQLGYRVLLIDADLRRPSLHKAFSVPNAFGLANYLAGSSQLAGMLHTPVQNLTFMPCGPSPSEPTELLANSRMKTLLTYGNKHFDMLILDGPPILELADAPLLASMTEGTLMVVSANHVRHAVVRTRLKRLQQTRVKLAGLVLTKFDMRQANSYYYYADYSSAYEYHAVAEQYEGKVLASGREHAAEADHDEDRANDVSDSTYADKQGEHPRDGGSAPAPYA